MAVPLRAALYLRVSTARQAEHDVSIPDQKRQGEAYCASRGYQVVETYVEAGASATNDRRPEFQKMMEAGTAKPPARSRPWSCRPPSACCNRRPNPWRRPGPSSPPIKPEMRFVPALRWRAATDDDENHVYAIAL